MEHAQPEAQRAVESNRRALLNALTQHLFNYLPSHLIRISDMKLLSRTDLRDDFCTYVSDLSEPDFLALRSPQAAVQARIKYAIFSHRWGPHEPSYQQLSRDENWMDHPTLADKPGLLKLLRFCDKARAHGYRYAWSDTCCIDKSSSAELEEAIRAMYRWYRDADVCIVHLSATETLSDFEHEPWFTRGWTLQELLAPKRIMFYNKDWVHVSPEDARPAESINDKDDWRVLGAISKVTGIPAGDLRHFRPGCERVSEKMRWASQRETTRVEDVAYSLLGVFDIMMSVSYGEGKWAFRRLMEGIAHQCSEPGFFAWAGDASPYSFALPCSPASFGTPVLDAQTAASLRLTGSVVEEVGDREYSVTKLGLQVKLLLLPVRWIQQTPDAVYYTLSLTEGNFLETKLQPTLSQAHYEIFKPEQCVLGVVNYIRLEGDRGSLRVGDRYFCFLLKPSGGSYYIKARTDQVLVFQCVEGITKDVVDVSLRNTHSSYGQDVTTY